MARDGEKMRQMADDLGQFVPPEWFNTGLKEYPTRSEAEADLPNIIEIYGMGIGSGKSVQVGWVTGGSKGWITGGCPSMHPLHLHNKDGNYELSVDAGWY